MREHAVRDIELGRAHDGRRDRGPRGGPRLTGAEREALVLETLGIFRVATRKSLVVHCFDGHPFAAGRSLAKLRRKGLVGVRTVSKGRYGYQVFMLTPRGRDAAAARRRRKRQPEVRAVEAPDQRFWAWTADDRRLRHDHQLLDAVVQDCADDLRAGARIRRVRIDSELRGLLASADATGRRDGGPAGARCARREAARVVGLRVFDEDVPLPDALVELERADGTVETRGIEVATGFYTAPQVREKQRAGFRLFRLRSDRQPRRRIQQDEEFPLAWGRGGR